MNKPFIVLVDGDSASGKGTVAAHLAARFNLAHLDTGMIYRAVGLLCHRAGIAPEDTQKAADLARAWCTARDLSILQDIEIKTVEAGFYATLYAGQNPVVRAELFEFQKDFCRLPHPDKRGAVLDGRHLAFEIWPEADVKFYITASTAVRAERRRLQLEKLGLPAEYATILNDIEQRDRRNNDMLMQKLGINSVVAPGALLIDSSHMTLPEVLEKATAAVESHLAGKKAG